MDNSIFRTGLGIDIHKFAANRKLVLGGVEIPHTKGLLGHSDADVLVHSICDALLGAAGFEDIGHQFPDTDPQYKNISSLLLLEKTYKLLQAKKFVIVNTDSMLLLEKPKIYQYIEQMKKNISTILRTKHISIKATTSESLGFVGQNRGAVSYTTVLIKRKNA